MNMEQSHSLFSSNICSEEKHPLDHDQPQSPYNYLQSNSLFDTGYAAKQTDLILYSNSIFPFARKIYPVKSLLPNRTRTESCMKATFPHTLDPALVPLFQTILIL